MAALAVALVVVTAAGVSSALPATSSLSSGEWSEGRLSIHHADNLERDRSATKGYYLSSARGEKKLVLTGRPPDELIGSPIRVRGRSKAGAIHVAADGFQQLGSAELATTTSSTASGARRVAVVLFNFANDTQQPYTADYARGIAFTNINSVAAYYAVNSWGRLTLSGDVFGWVTIPHTNASCAYSTWASAAATAAGVDVAIYDHVVYAFPQTSCGWAGLASMPGKSSWLNGPMAMSLRLMAHELGHNLGTHHASEYRCSEGGTRVALSASTTNCTTGEYGDPFSVMGGSARHEHTNFSRGNFGWLAPANTVTVTQSGDHLLAPIEFETATGVTALRVARTSSSYFTLEFRQPDGTPFDSFSATSALANGIIIRLTAGSYSTLSQTWLVWAHPSTTYCECNAPLRAGESLTDPLSGVTFSVVGISSTGAVVNIVFGSSPPTAGPVSPTPTPVSPPTPSPITSATPQPTATPAVTPIVSASPGPTATATPTMATDRQPPSAPAQLEAQLARGRKVWLAWAPSTDNVGVAGYRVFRDDTQIGVTGSATFIDSAGGKKGSAYQYYVVAYDAGGNVSAPSNPVTVRP